MFSSSAFVSLLIGSAILLLPNLFLPPSETAEPQGKINLTVRDSLSGQRVVSEVVSRSSNLEKRASTDELGKVVVAALGRTDLTVSAAGYDQIKTYFVLGPGEMDVTVWLDSVDQKSILMAEAVNTAAPDESITVFEGFVYDSDGKPAADALVSVGPEKSSKTDQFGWFKIDLTTPGLNPETELPEEAVLTVEREGQVVYKRERIYLHGGKSRFIIDLGEGVKIADGRHKFQLERNELADVFERPEIAEPYFSEAPAAVPVPASIRVGSNCATATTCTTVNVYAIDTYVRNGLDDEWIASWNANSVKAGAIAYRSYGSYHVFHPRVPASYDICNTTSCQVNDPSDTHVNSNSATVQTTGSIVTNAAGTDALFSEYSAENNLAPGCPDGSTGRPEHNWPCLADPVDVGTTYFGHGRGMCQWGSQRWSINQGKDFVWVVNHYYNANGNPSGLRTGVLQLGPDTLLPPPTLTEPGNQTAPGVTISTFTPTFQWQPVAGAAGYSLYVSRFNGSTYDVVYNSETALGQPIAATTFTLPAGILVAGGQYRWNMSSYIPAGYGTPNTFRNYFTVSSNATISGRVTTPAGAALRNAIVTITDDLGVRRTATTSSFGIYTFNDIAIGRSVTVTASTKRYRFTPVIFTVAGNVSNIDLVGLE